MTKSGAVLKCEDREQQNYNYFREKIKFEFECFFLKMKACSRDNIFANAKEIAIKQLIYQVLSSISKDKFAATKIDSTLQMQTNFLDGIYLRMINKGDSFFSVDTEDILTITATLAKLPLIY